MVRMTADKTIKKVIGSASPRAAEGQRYLASGRRVAMRVWEETPAPRQPSRQPYETVGYVIAGRAELILEGQTVALEPGDSWLVPPDTEHAYRVIEAFVAVEATAPPAQVHARDTATDAGAAAEANAMHPAGQHARPEMTDAERTPGTGALPEPDQQAIEPGTG